MGGRPLLLAVLILTPALAPVSACGRDAPAVDREARAPSPQVRSRETLVIPAGTRFMVRLDQDLTTGSHGPGDPFGTSLMGALVDHAGSELVPTGAVVRGRVTAVAPPGPMADHASMTLAFEAVSFRGRSFPVHAVVDQVVGSEDDSPRVSPAGPAAGTIVPLEPVAGVGRLPRGARLSVRLIEPVHLGPVNGRGP